VSEQQQPSHWDEQKLVDPHALPDKAGRVRGMFAAIADSYDLNNRLHSLGRDQAWRRAAVRMAEVTSSEVVLDVACGTGDLALAFAEAGPNRVIGSDFTLPMLKLARQKAGATRVGDRVAYHAADALRLPLADQSVDVVSIAFGIRNVTDPAAALAEFHRVLRPGGRVIVLEFGLPRHRLLRAGYDFYFNHILPRTASLIARDRTGAYRYLPRSVHTFLDRPATEDLIGRAGFTAVTSKPLTFGIAICYRGTKSGDAQT
jgi:demethylmenaquinone methyltransferase/2-methoxy-6-polyprenyl-1,4-benzoquinol methylase